MRAGLGVVLAWQHYAWETLLELTRHAEACHYDVVYTDGDVSMMPGRGDGDVLDGATLTAALLSATTCIGVGSIRLVQHWNPARLAQWTATHERLFPGRLHLLLGIGGQATDQRFGLPWAPPAERATWLEETVLACRALWRGEPVTQQGAWVKLDRAQIRPRMPAGRPELEIACGASSPLLPVVARHAERWDMNLPPSPHRIRTALRALEDACAEQGRDPASIGRQVWVMTRPHGGSSSDELRKAFRRWHPWFSWLPDQEIPEVVVAGSSSACQEQLGKLRAAGIDRPLLDLTGLDRDAAHQAIDALAP
ncbi:MAG: LLM class flavin-dependent oxidoreductase [bacterium]|nr:LLM class flavin-dependent oxidoreductase [bacterium]